MEEFESRQQSASQSRQQEPRTEATGRIVNDGEEPRYTLRHNKSDVSLTLGELLTTAEKGLDYDRIRPSHEFVKQLAQRSGESDIARYLAKAREQADEKAADKQAEQTDTKPEAAADMAAPAQQDAQKKAEMEAIEKEYPQYVQNGTLALPEAARLLAKGGMSPLEACRATDLLETKALCAQLEAKLGALEECTANAAASIGSLSGGETPLKDYYTAKEWDRLPGKQKEQFIKSGKIYEFMRRWNAE